MDTAPTGHTLLLLDATGAYHREVARQTGKTGPHFRTPMMQLQEGLRRAGIEPWAWIVNSSVAAAKPHSPLLRQRARNELREINSVAELHAGRYAVVPLLKEEPVGVERMSAQAGCNLELV